MEGEAGTAFATLCFAGAASQIMAAAAATVTK